MEIKQQYATKNECYQYGAKLNVRKLMVHSTACPGVMAARFATSWNTYRPSNRQVCVHAFLDDKECIQLLPWNIQGWHCGGSGNQQAIGIEICEPSSYNDKEYFQKVIKNAVEVYAYLCKKFGLTSNDILSHAEGYKKGIASNHGDPAHWWKYMNYTMDDFRADVKEYMNSGKVNVTVSSSTSTSTTTSSSKAGDVLYQAYANGKWWDYVKNYGSGTEGYAGVIGQPMKALRAYVKGDAKEVGYLEYRVHKVGGGWYNWQRDQQKDSNGENYAGDLKSKFDGLQMRIVGVSGKHVKYRVHVIGKGWLGWVTDYGNGDNGYAGWYGYAIDAVQIDVV